VSSEEVYAMAQDEVMSHVCGCRAYCVCDDCRAHDAAMALIGWKDWRRIMIAVKDMLRAESMVVTGTGDCKVNSKRSSETFRAALHFMKEMGVGSVSPLEVTPFEYAQNVVATFARWVCAYLSSESTRIDALELRVQKLEEANGPR